jgi:hypothetical protein
VTVRRLTQCRQTIPGNMPSASAAPRHASSASTLIWRSPRALVLQAQ